MAWVESRAPRAGSSPTHLLKLGPQWFPVRLVCLALAPLFMSQCRFNLWTAAAYRST
jgi:hypothetical protein